MILVDVPAKALLYSAGMLNTGKPISWDPSESDLKPNPTKDEICDKRNGYYTTKGLYFKVFFEV